jgi:transitional endoplasmic reticulum ATPase
LAYSLKYLGQTELAAERARQAMALDPHNPRYAARAGALDADAQRPGASNGSIPRVTWDDVVLPERTKKELRQMQLLLENPAISRDLGIDPPTGLLLYGPPGTGKTTIARVLAHEAKCKFFATSPAEVNSMWLGESEKQVARLFAQARANAPSIVFLDEIDALLPARSGGGMTRNGRVFVVGATNRRDMLDPALLRGGRLSREIEIPLPDEQARRALFALTTRGAKLADDVNLAELAERTEKYSGANIKALVNEAGLQALIRIADSGVPGGERSLCRADFEEALINFKPQDEPPPNPWRMFG